MSYHAEDWKKLGASVLAWGQAHTLVSTGLISFAVGYLLGKLT